MHIPIKPEKIHEWADYNKGCNFFYRIKTIGGWIILNNYINYHEDITRESMCFVPDENHSWSV